MPRTCAFLNDRTLCAHITLCAYNSTASSAGGIIKGNCYVSCNQGLWGMSGEAHTYQSNCCSHCQCQERHDLTSETSWPILETTRHNLNVGDVRVVLGYVGWVELVWDSGIQASIVVFNDYSGNRWMSLVGCWQSNLKGLFSRWIECPSA